MYSGQSVPLTLDTVVVRTGVGLLALLTAAAATFAGVQSGAVSPIPFLVAGSVLNVMLFVMVFAKSLAMKLFVKPWWYAIYTVVTGAFVGSWSAFFSPELIMTALAATGGVFVGMLILHVKGWFRVQGRFRSMVYAASLGAFVMMLVNAFLFDFSLRGDGALGLGFGLLCLGLATLGLSGDFSVIDESIEAGVDEKYGWWLSMALLSSVVWIYMEILRLLSRR
jgi:uncharacterized YccA/Bax inhibitor family protein